MFQQIATVIYNNFVPKVSINLPMSSKWVFNNELNYIQNIDKPKITMMIEKNSKR